MENAIEISPLIASYLLCNLLRFVVRIPRPSQSTFTNQIREDGEKVEQMLALGVGGSKRDRAVVEDVVKAPGSKVLRGRKR